MIEPRKIQAAVDVLKGAIEELQKDLEDKIEAYDTLKKEFDKLEGKYEAMKRWYQ